MTVRAEYISEMSIACSVFTCADKRQLYAFKTAATIERILADSRYAIGYGYARKTAATIERILADNRYAIGYSYARKTVAILERTRLDTVAARNDYRL